MSNLTYEIINKKAYRAVGMMWDGTWSEVHQLKEVIQTMAERVHELTYAIEPNMQLGLSYHYRPDGFTHYSMYEVTEEQEIPPGMIEFRVPELTYFVIKHGGSYNKVSQWLTESEYKPYTDPKETYFDPIPIKHEKYPHDRDLENPDFEIWIPIVKKGS